MIKNTNRLAGRLNRHANNGDVEESAEKENRRDLKAANVLLTMKGPTKVKSFGLAKKLTFPKVSRISADLRSDGLGRVCPQGF